MTEVCDECGQYSISTKWCDHGRVACPDCRENNRCRYCVNQEKP